MNNYKALLMVLLLTLMGATPKLSAQTPTWAGDVAQILYGNCTSCHHQGGLAPNPLLSYPDAYAYRFQIKQYVDDGYMPPWPPSASYKHLAFERVLSESDKTKISDWVLGGAPEGNAASAPPVPVYGNSASALQTINFTAKMPDYTVNTATDLYRCFVINTNFAQDMFAAEIEVKPGNPSIVHHVLLYEDSTMLIKQLDSAQAGAGYTNFYGTGSNASNLIGEWVPGTQHIRFPDKMGVRLKKNTRLIMQIHYPKGTYMKLDSTRVNIRFATNTSTTTFPPFREVVMLPALSEVNLVNGPLVIPPNVVKTFTASNVATTNPPPPLGYYTMLSVAPHMHLIGKEMKVYSIEAGTQDTLPLIHIPKWDFKWQGVYNFRNPIRIAQNSTLVAESAYDNTSSNLSNPSSPPVQVTQGEATTDEMMLVFFAFTYYLPGDENIVIDDSPVVGIKELENTTGRGLELYSVSPNPMHGQGQLNFYCPTVLNAKARITDVSGRLISEWAVRLDKGYGALQFPTTGLGNGQYYISLQSKTLTKSKPFIIYE